MSNEIITESKLETLTVTSEERQITCHCFYPFTTFVRVWKSTFLVCKQTGTKVPVTHALNVPWYPNYILIPAKERFTLIFGSLPKECTSFDLVEQIPEPGGFESLNIQRNHTDVYTINFR